MTRGSLAFDLGGWPGHQMMAGNHGGVKDLIVETSRESTVYRDIRLVSHHSGEIVASG